MTGEGTFSRKAKVDSPPTVEVRSEANCCEECGAVDAAGAAGTSCIDGVATLERLGPAPCEAGNCTGDGIFAKKSKAGSGSMGIGASAMSIQLSLS